MIRSRLRRTCTVTGSLRWTTSRPMQRTRSSSVSISIAATSSLGLWQPHGTLRKIPANREKRTDERTRTADLLITSDIRPRFARYHRMTLSVIFAGKSYLVPSACCRQMSGRVASTADATADTAYKSAAAFATHFHRAESVRCPRHDAGSLRGQAG